MLSSKAQVIDELESTIPRCAGGVGSVGWVGGRGAFGEVGGVVHCIGCGAWGAVGSCGGARWGGRQCLASAQPPADAVLSTSPLPSLHHPHKLTCSWIERLLPGLYPHYISVLRVDPEKLGSVDLQGIWAEATGEEDGE